MPVLFWCHIEMLFRQRNMSECCFCSADMLFSKCLEQGQQTLAQFLNANQLLINKSMTLKETPEMTGLQVSSWVRWPYWMWSRISKGSIRTNTKMREMSMWLPWSTLTLLSNIWKDFLMSSCENHRILFWLLFFFLSP